MTTTLSSIQAGSTRIAFVFAIDGYPYLVSNASEALVQAAWAATDWAAKDVIPNLMVRLDNEQHLDPWKAFTGGGRLVVSVVPDATDQLGTDIARSDSGVESLLTVTANRTRTEINVETADYFTTLELHLGAECFSYKLSSGNALHIYGSHGYVPKRGKYTAFPAYSTIGTGSEGFADHHRVTIGDNGVRLQPIVSEEPRTWSGRRVSLWMHVYESDGSLNTKEDALCVFAGILDEASESGEKPVTEISCTHILDRIKDFALGTDFFECTIGAGHYLAAGRSFQFVDYNGVTNLTAGVLRVVTNGASGSNEINAGQYSLEEIASKINEWLAGEKLASRIHGNYTLACPEYVNDVPKSVMHFFIPSAANAFTRWRLRFPTIQWAKTFGIENAVGSEWIVDDVGNLGHAAPSIGSPKPVTIFSDDGGAFQALTLIKDSTGTFHDNTPTLPAGVKAVLGNLLNTYEWGLFLVELETPVMIVGRIANGALRNVQVIDTPVAPNTLGGIEALKALTVELGEAPPRLRQVFLHEGPFRDVYRWLFYSTGTRNYNHPTHDVLPYGQGLGLPYGMLGENFDDSLDLMPRANDTILLCVDKPRKLADICAADLKLRCASLIWREGGLRWAHWSTPSADTATAELTESTKAEPAGVEASHRSPSVLDRQWVRNVVKIQYDRDITRIGEGGSSTYRSAPLVIVDATSVDDQSGAATSITLNADNVYGEYDSTGQGVRALAAHFAAWMPLFSRPVRKVHRSIDLRYFEGFGVGDTVTVTDPYVRDPSTGERGTIARPGTVIRHRYQISTGEAGRPIGLSGECDAVFLGSDRTYAYSPCAEVDWEATNGGLVDNNNTLQFRPHDHSNSEETVDIGRFAANDVCTLVEVDPGDVSAPDTIAVTISSVNAGSNQCDVTSDISGSWNANKRYRLIARGYTSVPTQQKSKAFQASSNGRIFGTTTRPMLYGEHPNFTFPSGVHKPNKYYHHEIPELPATLSYGPNTGPPRDSGYDKELAILLENLMDHKTNRSTPFLDNVERGNSTFAGYQLLSLRPIFLGYMMYGGSWNRYLWVRPMWAVLPGLTESYPTVSIRVALMAKPPADDSLNEITFNFPAVWQTWSRPMSDTAYRIDSEKPLSLREFSKHQWAYLLIEGSYGCATLGLAQAHERERFVP